jgi:hypothetical protein
MAIEPQTIAGLGIQAKLLADQLRQGTTGDEPMFAAAIARRLERLAAVG